VERSPRHSGFLQSLRDLGYVEGRDVIIEWRDAEGYNDRLPALAADLVRLGVDVIVASGPEARNAAIKATATIPIVAMGASDPVAEAGPRAWPARVPISPG
jgi:putative tryptophan/tyrosine transport system substrate-binding protein